MMWGAVAVVFPGLHHGAGCSRGGGSGSRMMMLQDGRPGRRRKSSWMIQLESAPIHSDT